MKAQREICFPEAREEKFYSYPAHKVLGVFDKPEIVKQTLNDLKENGFHETDIEVICNAGQIDFSGEEHGFWERIVRSLQYFGSEGKYLARYEQELKDGHFLLTVVAKNVETKEKVKEILQSHGGHRLTYFGNWLIEGIPEAHEKKFDTYSYDYRRELENSFEENLLRK